MHELNTDKCELYFIMIKLLICFDVLTWGIITILDNLKPNLNKEHGQLLVRRPVSL